MTNGLGLSIGATNLTAVAVGRAAVRRSAVLTLYPHRPPEVGVPSENPNLAERGLILTDFVDRVGDPVGLLAPDGSSHRADVLLADALRAMLRTVDPGAGGEPVGIAYPAHWRPPAVEALRGALLSMPEFRAPRQVHLSPDATAALTALQQHPGVPARGVVAVCDFGGTGTSITLADAANGFAPLAPTERHLDFSGDQVDQALLTHVVGGLSSAGSVDLTGTSAIGSLTRLRAQCRAAKERLSTASVTALAADLPGHGGDIRVTRTELDEAIRDSLAAFVEELQQTLQRIGIRPGDLAAVATVGGGARIPLVTTTLSENLRVPIITGAHPELAAAIGGGLLAVRGTVVEDATSMAPAAGAAAAAAVAAAAGAGAASAAAGEATQASDSRALAWSDADDVPDVAPSETYEPQAYQPQPYEPDVGESARPRLAFAETEEPEQERRRAWYRNPFAVMAIALAVVLAAIGAAVLLTRSGDDEPAPPSDTTTTTAPPPPTPAPESTAPAPPPAPAEPGAGSAPPPQRTVTRQPAPPPAPEAPPPSTEPPPPPPPPSTEPPPPPPPPSTEPPPPPPSTQPPIIPTLPYPTIPGLPFVPAPVLPAP
ncbi:Hsp70 family protein [Mycolicibacterium sp. GCM10028919]|uniref:Hsp70 family protein n=1 Tax=Mycolicibacterium sp. GCM10028919 TaxID=3273401 RepID=UPI0036178342